MRKQYVGGAVEARLIKKINAVATTFEISAFTGWPTGASGLFVVIIGRDTTEEEVLLCASRVDGVVQVQQRGYDNTRPQSHNPNTTVEIELDASVIDEGNAHVTQTGRDDHTQYVNATRHQPLVHSVDQPPQTHDLVGARHTAAGLTTGHFLRATGATTFAFGAGLDADFPATIARDTEVALQSLAVAKGDLLAASAASTWAKLAAIANGQAVIADSSQAAGMRGQAVSSTDLVVLDESIGGNSAPLPEFDFLIPATKSLIIIGQLSWERFFSSGSLTFTCAQDTVSGFRRAGAFQYGVNFFLGFDSGFNNGAGSIAVGAADLTSQQVWDFFYVSLAPANDTNVSFSFSCGGSAQWRLLHGSYMRRYLV